MSEIAAHEHQALFRDSTCQIGGPLCGGIDLIRLWETGIIGAWRWQGFRARPGHGWLVRSHRGKLRLWWLRHRLLGRRDRRRGHFGLGSYWVLTRKIAHEGSW